MFERSAGPPLFGLILVSAVGGIVGWAATADTDPAIDKKAATPITMSTPAEPPAGAARSRAAE